MPTINNTKTAVTSFNKLGFTPMDNVTANTN